MKSLRPAALLVAFVVFDVLSICQGNRRVVYVLSGNSDFGDQGPYGGGPLQLGPSRDSYTSPSSVIQTFGGPGYRLAPHRFPGGMRSSLNAEANYGSRDTGRIRGIARITRRRTILILIRKRRPPSLDGSYKGEDRERWSRPSAGDSWGDYYRRQQLQVKHALLRAILKKILLSAARQRAARGEGSDVDDQWNRSEQGGQQYPGGGSVGRSDTTEARGRPWGSNGHSSRGIRLVIVVRKRNGEGGSLGGFSSGHSTENARRVFLGELMKRLIRRMSARDGEADGYNSESGNGGTGYGILDNVRGHRTEGAGTRYNEVYSFGSGGPTDTRRSVASHDAFSSRHLPWQSNGFRFPKHPSHFTYSSGGGPFGGMHGALLSGEGASSFYAGWTPWLHVRRIRLGYPERVQNSGLGGWYGSGFKHIFHSGLSGGASSRFIDGLGGDYGSAFRRSFYGRENAYSPGGDRAVAAGSTSTFEGSSPFSVRSSIGTKSISPDSFSGPWPQQSS